MQRHTINQPIQLAIQIRLFSHRIWMDDGQGHGKFVDSESKFASNLPFRPFGDIVKNPWPDTQVD